MFKPNCISKSLGNTPVPVMVHIIITVIINNNASSRGIKIWVPSALFVCWDPNHCTCDTLVLFKCQSWISKFNRWIGEDILVFVRSTMGACADSCVHYGYFGCL